MDRMVFAIDIGGTQLRAAIVDSEGGIHDEVRRATPATQGPDVIVGTLLEMYAESTAQGSAQDISAIGIAAPGPVEPKTGTLIDPPNLPGWGRRSLSDPFEEKLGIRAYVGNDANLGALGERRFGGGQGVDDLLYLTVSTGVGGGIVSGGQLITGWRGYAAEVGHQVILPDGPLCGCGRRGHLEALASGPAIARQARELIQTGQSSVLSSMVTSNENITAETVAEAARGGDALSVQVFEKAGYYLGLGIANLIHLFEPQRILIGGGVSKAGAILFDPLRRTVKESLMSEVFLDVEIASAQLAGETGILGAASLALDHVA